MKNDLDLHMLLSVFEKIRTHGEKQENSHKLEGITATSDFDGYTVVMSDAQCTMTLFFHNKYEFDFPSEKARESFEKKVNFVDKNY